MENLLRSKEHFTVVKDGFVEPANEETLSEAQKKILVEEGDVLHMAFTRDSEEKEEFWILDSGCSNHICRDKSWFSNLDEELWHHRYGHLNYKDLRMLKSQKIW